MAAAARTLVGPVDALGRAGEIVRHLSSHYGVEVPRVQVGGTRRQALATYFPPDRIALNIDRLYDDEKSPKTFDRAICHEFMHHHDHVTGTYSGTINSEAHTPEFEQRVNEAHSIWKGSKTGALTPQERTRVMHQLVQEPIYIPDGVTELGGFTLSDVHGGPPAAHGQDHAQWIGAPLQTVRLDQPHYATQGYLYRDKLITLIINPHADDYVDYFDRYPLYCKVAGKLWSLNGHHRSCAAYMSGEYDILAHVVDPVELGWWTAKEAEAWDRQYFAHIPEDATARPDYRIEDGHLIKAAAANQVMYHVTDSRNRDSIAENGLQAAHSNDSKHVWLYPTLEQAHAHRDLFAGRKLMDGTPVEHDIYAVDVSGLRTKKDPHRIAQDAGGRAFQGDIEPHRLSRVAGRAPQVIMRGIHLRNAPPLDGHPEKVAHSLLHAATQHGAGLHWSKDPGIAYAMAEGYGPPRGSDYTGATEVGSERDTPGGLPVVLHADHPGGEHVERSQRVRRQHGAGGEEVMLHPTAPVHIKGISWLHPEHGWQDHSFEDSQSRVAGKAGDLPEAETWRKTSSSGEELIHPSDWWDHTRDLSLPHHQQKVRDLASNIHLHGYQPQFADLPIHLVLHKGQPAICDGNHRLKAMQLLGYDEPVPAVVSRTAKTTTAELANPHSGRHNEWFHGSGAEFDQFEFGHEGGSWNDQLGFHFSSLHNVAATFSKTTQWVYHVRLDIRNPKYYRSEFDMTREAFELSPHHPEYQSIREMESWLADRPEMGRAFKVWLESHGYDGVLYGNEYSPPIGHICAIAFYPQQIHITKIHPASQACEYDEGVGFDPGGRKPVQRHLVSPLS